MVAAVGWAMKLWAGYALGAVLIWLVHSYVSAGLAWFLAGLLVGEVLHDGWRSEFEARLRRHLSQAIEEAREQGREEGRMDESSREDRETSWSRFRP
jgi:hypothetical protein